MTDRKVALVTGSGKRRVGAVVAKALATSGYSLAIHCNRSVSDAEERAAALREQGTDAIVLQADLRDEVGVREMIARTVERFGRLDVLVNCAAVWGRKPLEEITADDVRLEFEINTLGTFLCSQHAGLAMVKQPTGGCIVTFSDWAITRPYLGHAAYFPSKGAIPTLTRVLAVELGSRNPRVRVNCILPGPVMLPANLAEAERRQAIESTLVKREGRPEHIAQTVLFLVENDFMTGACLTVDGGRTVFAPDSL